MNWMIDDICIRKEMRANVYRWRDFFWLCSSHRQYSLLLLFYLERKSTNKKFPMLSCSLSRALVTCARMFYHLMRRKKERKKLVIKYWMSLPTMSFLMQKICHETILFLLVSFFYFNGNDDHQKLTYVEHLPRWFQSFVTSNDDRQCLYLWWWCEYLDLFEWKIIEPNNMRILTSNQQFYLSLSLIANKSWRQSTHFILCK